MIRPIWSLAVLFAAGLLSSCNDSLKPWSIDTKPTYCNELVLGQCASVQAVKDAQKALMVPFDGAKIDLELKKCLSSDVFITENAEIYGLLFHQAQLSTKCRGLPELSRVFRHIENDDLQVNLRRSLPPSYMLRKFSELRSSEFNAISYFFGMAGSKGRSTLICLYDGRDEMRDGHAAISNGPERRFSSCIYDEKIGKI